MAREGLREFSSSELRTFLGAIDAELPFHATFKVLGGSAIALAYDVDLGTTDIDTFETDLLPLEVAIRRARVETGLDIPVSSRGGAVGDRPYESDARLVRVMSELRHLEVYTLEKHDLALSKAVRGYENDLDALAQLHQAEPLDKDVLIERYLREMGHAIGDRSRLDSNFVRLIDRLFGEIEAERVEARLRKRRSR